jgi:hypothetical protein
MSDIRDGFLSFSDLSTQSGPAKAHMLHRHYLILKDARPLQGSMIQAVAFSIVDPSGRDFFFSLFFSIDMQLFDLASDFSAC